MLKKILLLCLICSAFFLSCKSEDSKKDLNSIAKKKDIAKSNVLLLNLHEITIGENTLYVEIADTPQKSRKGLMYRKNLPENQGMLFIYPKPSPLVFWMKNTYIPLDIAFLTEDGMIVNIEQMKPLDTSVRYNSKGLAKYAIEVNLNWFSEHGVEVGDVVDLDL